MEDCCASLLIIGIGNRSRGDDALGPLLLDRLRACAETGPVQIEYLEVYQLQVEHTLDMQRHTWVWFLDAALGLEEAFRFEPVLPAQDSQLLFSHAMPPSALLAVYRQVYGDMPQPDCFQMAVRGEAFELGALPSAGAQRHLDLAAVFLGQRIRALQFADHLQGPAARP
ncbi:MAG: hypothetical protein RIQ52_406 [Pseudomonadota bacterium]